MTKVMKSEVLELCLISSFSPSLVKIEGIRFACCGMRKDHASLVSEELPAGNYEIEFSANNGGSDFASGMYFYRLQVGDPSTSSGQSFVETKKMLLMK